MSDCVIVDGVEVTPDLVVFPMWQDDALWSDYKYVMSSANGYRGIKRSWIEICSQSNRLGYMRFCRQMTAATTNKAYCKMLAGGTSVADAIAHFQSVDNMMMWCDPEKTTYEPMMIPYKSFLCGNPVIKYITVSLSHEAKQLMLIKSVLYVAFPQWAKERFDVLIESSKKGFSKSWEQLSDS